MKTLYILHGWSFRNIEPWQEVKKALKGFGIDAKLICLPGFDLSKSDQKSYDVKDYLAFIKTQLPKGAIALGHSNGGRLLLNLMSEDPHFLKAAILLNSAGIYEYSRKKQLIQRAAKTFSFLKRVPLLRKIVHRITGSDYGHAPKNMQKTLTNMLSSDQKLQLQHIQTPVRIIWGEDDRTTPLRQGQKLNQLLPKSNLRVISGWDHTPYFKHPAQLAKVIAEEYNILVEEKL